MSSTILRPAAFAAASALLAISIGLYLPIAAVANAITDDALTVRLAGHIFSAEWFGAYDIGTLMAGVPYTAVVAKAAFFGVPLKVAEALVQLAAAGAMAFVLVRLGLAAWLGAVVFALLAVNPAPLSPTLMRVTGEAFAGSLALLAVAALAFALLDETAGARLRRGALAVFGAAFGLLWLQEASTAWIYPALAVPVLPYVPGGVRALRARPVDAQAWRGHGARFGLDAAFVVGAFALVVLPVAALNAAAYGAFVTSEARSGGFVDAVGAITRITPVAASQRFEFTRDVAAHAYRVSAALRELKPALDGAVGQTWRAAGCRASALNPCPPGFGGGTLIWALRDAARAAGHMNDAAAADAFFARVADEIDAACDAGDVPCGASRSSLTSPLRAGEWRSLPGSIAASLAVTTRLGGGQAGAVPSEGSAAEVAAFTRLIGAVTPPGDGAVTLAGWVAARGCLPRPVIVEADGSQTEPELSAAGDVDAFFRQKGEFPQTQRFKVRAPCREGACVMRLDGCDEDEGVPVWSLSAGRQTARGNTVLFVDSVAGTGDAAEPAADDSWAAGVARAIASAYAALGPVVAPFAVIMFLLAWIASRDYPESRKVWIVAAACFAAVVGRAIYVGYLDVTTMPAADIRHMAPAAPFFILFVGLAAALAFTTLLGRLRSGQDEKKS